MRCRETGRVDFVAYLAEPGGRQWEAFRAHFPGCPDCAHEVARWTRMEAGLSMLATEASEHPAETLLLQYEDEPARLSTTGRAGVEAHLGSCSICRDSVAALRSFDFSAASQLSQVSAARSQSPSPSPLTRIANWLGEFLAPAPQPVMAFGLLALLALPIGVYLATNPAPTSQQVAEHTPIDPKPPAQPSAHEPPVEVVPDAIQVPEPLPASIASPERETQFAQELEILPDRIEVPKPAPEPISAPDAATRVARQAPARGSEVARVAPVETIPPPQPVVVAALDPALLPTSYPSYASPWGGQGPSGRMESLLRSAGGANDDAHIALLAPREIGRTADPQPTLYYFVPQRTEHPIAITVTVEFEADALVEQQLAPPVDPGIYALSLRDADVSLPVGKNLTWSAALLRDPTRYDRNPTTLAHFQRMEPNAELEQLLENSPTEYAPHLYAAHGLWYDAIDALSAFIEQHPEVVELRLRRAALMHAEGLENAAAFDRVSP